MISAGVINQIIKDGEVDTNLVSDGYHTFGELYEHRIALFIALCKRLADIQAHTGYKANVWRSQKHHDGTMYPGWFIMGINYKPGEIISYHLPMEKWQATNYITETLPTAPEWDGHTSQDVIKRLLEL